MKTLLWTFLAAVLIAGGVVWSRRMTRPVVVIPAPTRATIRQTNTSMSRLTTPGSAQPRFRTPWAALQSGDYGAFVQLLRESGCPEETVRLFAVAAVGRDIQKRLDAPECDQVKASVYWREDWRSAPYLLPTEMLRQRARLETALAGLLNIAGGEFRQEFVEFNQLPDWLPTSQRAELSALLARQRTELQDAEKQGFVGNVGTAVDESSRARFLEIRNRYRSELEALLGPVGLAEYEARESMEARYVRQSLPPAQSEDEFRRLVAAARDVGFTESEMLTDSLPPFAQVERPKLRERILARFQDLSDPDRAAELQEAAVAEDGQAQEERKMESENRRIRELQSFAKSGGVELSEEDATSLNAAIQQRGAELDRELGDPDKLPPEARNAFLQRLRVEFEKVAVAKLGDKGRVVAEQMWKKVAPGQTVPEP